MYGADAATLVSQTIADNTQEAAGAGYTQVWTTKNSGTTTWDSSYSLQYVSGNAGCGHGTAALNLTVVPNGSVTWSLGCTAPSAAGTYREDWKLVGPSGTVPVGGSSTIWVQIVVSGGGGVGDAATLGSQTIADNTQEAAGAGYTQTWKIQNSGTTTWGSAYSLQYVSGNAGCNHTSATLVTIAPNTSVDVSVSCTAPSAAGTYREDWKLVGPSGTIAIGASSTVWVQIVVTAAGGDSATFVSETIPDNTQETAGAGYTQAWTIKNSGTATWGSSYSLQYVSGNVGCGHGTVPLSITVAPSGSVNWSLPCTAPSTAGTYREDWKLVGPSGTIPVGGYSTIWVQIVVPGSDAATFVSETIPDNTQEAAGAGYTQVWTIKNSGTTTWGSSYTLQYVSGNAGCNHAAAATLSVPIAPNTSVNWSLNCTAPSAAGTYREDWKMVGPSGTIAVGAANTIWVQVVVPPGLGN
jgi:hypothetical protein